MILVKKISEIRSLLNEERRALKKIAFVPTMGALHEGHLPLVRKAKELGKIVVVSIFVNKTQFNDLADFDKYPRQLEKDLEFLEKENIDYVFAPEGEEIFDKDFSFKIIPESLADSLCGAARKGHFDGVCLIVSKLFNIVKPDIAIFGKKDFQQLQVIKKMVKDFNFDIQIIGGEIVREEGGLAMSSRNQRLSQSAKIKAAMIFKTLQEIKKEILEEKNLTEVLQLKKENLLKMEFEKIDYLEIRQEKDLKLVENFDKNIPSLIFVAIYLEGVRLIDNLEL